MILISHRGNIAGPNKNRENSVDYILETLGEGYDVEIDVWKVSGTWYLGHDGPEYPTEEAFLLNKGLWCHAKNLEALNDLLGLSVRCFWHQNDDHVLTSNGLIWSYPGMPLESNSICVMPEKSKKESEYLSKCAGVCSDFISRYRREDG
jgi:hypothetical protein